MDLARSGKAGPSGVDERDLFGHPARDEMPQLQPCHKAFIHELSTIADVA